MAGAPIRNTQWEGEVEEGCSAHGSWEAEERGQHQKGEAQGDQIESPGPHL